MSSDKKPDFSNVQSGANTKATGGGGGSTGGTLAGARPDFSNVVSGADTVPGTAGGERSYTIEKGDTLSAIAQRVYGKAKYWRQIHEANRAEIEDPDRIFPGQVIRLPAIDTDGDGTPDDPSSA